MAKCIITGRKPQGKYYILRLKGRKTYHRVPADNLSHAKYKFLKGMKNVNERDIVVRKTDC